MSFVCFAINGSEVQRLRFVFHGLPGPNRVWLLVVYVFMTHPFLSLYGIIYVTWYTSHLPEPTGVLTAVVT